jgi:hypothetical protein
MLRVEHDAEARALYIYLSDKPYAFGEDLDSQRRIDFAEDRTPIGVELLYIDRGVDLTDIPRAAEIAEALRSYNVKIFA